MPPKNKSNVEAMKRYMDKIRADPEAYAAYKQKERDRYKKRKEAGKLPNIKNMQPRDQHQLRRKWKVDQRHRQS